MLKLSPFALITLITAIVILFGIDMAFAHTPSPPNCTEATCNIDLHDNSFDVKDITIRPPNLTSGESVTVVWENHGNFDHTVTSGTRGSPDGIFDKVLSRGETFQLEVNQSIYSQLLDRYSDGVVPYYCRFHSGMDGTLTITGEPIPEFSSPTFVLAVASMFSVLLLIVVHTRKWIAVKGEGQG